MHGIHTALVTPFTADDAVDYDAFAALCQRQLEGGVHGLVPCGTTGETPTLTVDEQDDLLRIALGVSDGAVPVTAGIGSNSTRQAVLNAARAQALGAHQGLLVLPWYNKPNPNGLAAHVKAVCEVGLPIVLYHVPGRTAQHVPAGLMAELCDVDGVVALKEATGDVRYGVDVMRALRAEPRRDVLSGDDFTFLGLMAQGATGCVSVVSNVDPAGTVAVFKEHRAGHVVKAAAALDRLWPLITALFVEPNPVPVKAALAELGLCSAMPRLPLAPYSGPSLRPLLTELGL